MIVDFVICKNKDKAYTTFDLIEYQHDLFQVFTKCFSYKEFEDILLKC